MPGGNYRKEHRTNKRPLLRIIYIYIFILSYLGTPFLLLNIRFKTQFFKVVRTLWALCFPILFLLYLIFIKRINIKLIISDLFGPGILLVIWVILFFIWAMLSSRYNFFCNEENTTMRSPAPPFSPFTRNLINYVNKLSKSGFLLYLFVLLVLLLFVEMPQTFGRIDAKTQIQYLTLESKPDVVVLRIYSDRLICSRYDRLLKTVQNQFTIFKNHSDPPISFYLENVGPLKPMK